ncbi:MAG: 4Fe-4S dicluster domain-containing protein [Desulfitobacteriaceae bacterium]
MKPKYTRRDFVISTAKVLAAGLLAPIGTLAATQRASAQEPTPQNPVRNPWAGKEWSFIIDTIKCIGCARCVEACKKENGVPLDREVYRTWVERYLVDSNEEVRIDSPRGGLDFKQQDIKPEKQFFVPKLCNQCHNAPCIQVCPVGATYKTGDGVVLVDRKRCIGCRYCIQACPYGARFLHPVLKVADKCTWCYHRISRGMLPACVQVCPMGARKFGNLKDPSSEVVALKKKARTRVLKPDMGTKPNVYYIDLDEVVK